MSRTTAPSATVTPVDRRRPMPLSRAGARTTLAAATLAIAGLAWWGSGDPIAVPVLVVAVVAGDAAWHDFRHMIIPNRALEPAAFVLVLYGAAVMVTDVDSYVPFLSDVAVGWLLSLAPVLIALWVIRPAAIGAGDWKLLTVLSVPVAMLAPSLTIVILLVAIPVTALITLYRRLTSGTWTATAPMGPGLALGYATAVTMAVTFNELFEGAYRA